ncbi:MAG: tRNA pseudouridine(38-40) synthase TruA [Candidatus Omnitrophota bacterium]
MRNIKLSIEYDGTNHSGWQVQRKPNIKSQKLKTQTKNQKFSTIQNEIEKALAKILQEKIRVIASGRTDSGVHAKAQIANFKTHTKLPAESIKNALNANLPDDIAISGAEDIDTDFHARFSAKSKLYRYTVLNRSNRSPLAIKYSYFIRAPLNVSAMKQAARVLLGRHDFKSFQATDKIERKSVRTIKKLSLQKKKDFIYMDVEADGFLYNMVRNIAGTLIDVGRGRIKPDDMKKILAARDRKKAGPAAPAKGLCLLKVNY